MCMHASAHKRAMKVKNLLYATGTSDSGFLVQRKTKQEYWSFQTPLKCLDLRLYGNKLVWWDTETEAYPCSLAPQCSPFAGSLAGAI